MRVSSPQKLRKTSYFHRGIEDEDDDEARIVLMKAIEIYLSTYTGKSWCGFDMGFFSREGEIKEINACENEKFNVSEMEL